MASQESKIHKLGNYGEIRGPLRVLNVDRWYLRASIGDYDIVLPREMEQKLRPLVGKLVGILHTDVPGKEYIIRTLSEEKEATQDALADNPLVSDSNNVACEVV